MEITEQSEPVRKDNRKRSIIIFAITSTLCVGLLALLWVQFLTPAQQNSNSGTNSTSNNSDPLLGKAAPDFSLSPLQNQSQAKISLTSLKGQLVVINFWSSTCAPCKDEAPLLETQSEKTKAQGVVFLGIDVLDDKTSGLNFLHQYGVTYTSLVDSNGSTLVSYGVTGTPETLFIDRSGKVVSTIRMEITAQQLQDHLQALLKTQ